MAVDLKNLCFGCMKELSPEKNICSCGWRRGSQNQSGQLRPGSLLGGNYAIVNHWDRVDLVLHTLL